MVANSSNYLKAHGSGKDMERALAHQAQLIGQYEEEEKAQREWEVKFRENNSSTPDSFEPGNHSDVTEERDETKDDAPSEHVGTTASQDQEAKSKAENIYATEESSKSQLNGFQSPPRVDLRCFPDQRSQPSDFEFPVATANQNMQSSAGNHSVSPSHSYHHRSHSEGPAGDQSPNTVPSESALIPHETPDTLESVLEALHQAKLQLKHKAYNPLPLMDSASVGKAIEFSVGDRRPEVPVGCPGLFRVPSDFHFEATVKSNFPSSNSQLSLTNHYPASGNALSAVDHFTTPFTVSSSLISNGNINLSGTNLSMESRSRIPEPPVTWSRFSYSDPSPRPSLGTDLPLSRRYSYTDPNREAAAIVSSSSTFVSPLYPHPNLMSRFPSDEGRRLFSSMGARITPSNRSSSYDGIIRPNYTSSSAFSSPAYPFPDAIPRIPSEERSRLFSSSGIPSGSGTGIPPQNHFASENDYLRRNAYR
jgi:hypothetical protein